MPRPDIAQKKQSEYLLGSREKQKPRRHFPISSFQHWLSKQQPNKTVRNMNIQQHLNS